MAKQKSKNRVRSILRKSSEVDPTPVNYIKECFGTYNLKKAGVLDDSSLITS